MKTIFLVLVLLLPALTLRAEPAAPAPVVVNAHLVLQLAQEARTNALSLQAAGARARAAQLNTRSIRSWDDPVLFTGVLFADHDTRSRDGDLIHGIEQKLPLFGRPDAARKVARAAEQTEQATLNLQFQELRRDIAQTLLRVAASRQILQFQHADLDWLSTLADSVRERYAAGTATQVEALRVQNERSLRAEEWVTAGKNLEHDILLLNRLLNRPLDQPWPPLLLPPLADAVPATLPRLSLAIRNEPRTQVLQSEIEVARATIAQTRLQKKPETAVTAEARSYSGDGIPREGMLTFRMSLPWLNANRYQLDVEREEQRLRASQLAASDHELSLRVELNRLLTDLDAARRDALLQQEQVIPRTEQAVDAASFAWQENRGPFRDLLEMRRMLIDSRIAHVKSIARQHGILSELALRCGIADSTELTGSSAHPIQTQPK